jgi:hypothetical protein
LTMFLGAGEQFERFAALDEQPAHGACQGTAA